MGIASEGGGGGAAAVRAVVVRAAGHKLDGWHLVGREGGRVAAVVRRVELLAVGVVGRGAALVVALAGRVDRRVRVTWLGLGFRLGSKRRAGGAPCSGTPIAVTLC